MPVTGNSASIIQSREENKWRVGFSDSQCHQGRSHRVSTAGPQWPIRRQQPSDSRAVSASPASALPIASDVDVWQPGTAPPPQGWSFSSRLLHLSRCLSLLGGGRKGGAFVIVLPSECFLELHFCSVWHFPPFFLSLSSSHTPFSFFVGVLEVISTEPSVVYRKIV